MTKAGQGCFLEFLELGMLLTNEWPSSKRNMGGRERVESGLGMECVLYDTLRS